MQIKRKVEYTSVCINFMLQCRLRFSPRQISQSGLGKKISCVMISTDLLILL
jgi:hypothetical protein